ncbi:sacsin N-terminal ATP-binding-like domain-containing protein [Paraburkholderia sp. MM5482-R1]|uniref:sacsin N-terminal ATP-binding-like domain-containing protein n=1 Tax=unclassified Paraburkholderia TaxID=2615204 RepID=UPI003D19EA3C
MDTGTKHVDTEADLRPVEYLETQVRAILEHAVDAHGKNIKVYESLKNLNEVIGTEYGNRVLYELLQNAHDAHRSGESGRIAIKLVINGDDDGTLYVANDGTGFRTKDVESVRNMATSAKDVGEGIGNKGLGFRSLEAITDDVRIYSRHGSQSTKRFDGYCFRFATVAEIEEILRSLGVDQETSSLVSRNIPRYLAPVPLDAHPEDIQAYAKDDYATVIAAPLKTEVAVTLAKQQVEALTHPDVPLMLFLDRINEISIEISGRHLQPMRRQLKRRQRELGTIASLPGASLHEVELDAQQRYAVVRYEVGKDIVLDAVRRSIPRAHQLKRWLDWKGIPVVSVAVGLSSGTVEAGRLYNFLPMGVKASAPVRGYLDGPFFTDIDRQNADASLPLNETLIMASARACAAAVLAGVEGLGSLPEHSIFDMFAWSGDSAPMFDRALEEAGTSLAKARVVPIFAPSKEKHWSSLSEVCIWPTGSFSVLKDRDVATRVGASLASSKLDKLRTDRLKLIARRARRFDDLVPSSSALTKWTVAFAQSLLNRKAAPRVWSAFYEDLLELFKGANTGLKLLSGSAIFLDRAGKLRSDGSTDEERRGGVYVRSDVPKGKRKKAGMPLPPATLARRYRFLDDRIILRRETLDAFVNAKLLHEYDPVEALSGLKAALGSNADPSRRSEALKWAFDVWRAVGSPLDDVVRKAGLFVPTLSGWHPANEAMFSTSWSSQGKVLENYLVTCAAVSPDCNLTLGLLLASQQDWPAPIQDSKRDWIRFLELLGVTDGLKPYAARMQYSADGYMWQRRVDHGDTSAGLDADWCAEVKGINFGHPYTRYEMQGAVWRLPGQLEHDKLPETAKEAFCVLAFKHLKMRGTRFLQFRVGRFERAERDWDSRILPTPLGAFLRSKPWIATTSHEGLTFRPPRQCWASQQRRGGPPRFLDRIAEAVADLPDEEELAKLAFSKALGLRDWLNPATAIERLRDLAAATAGLASNDRPTFRKEYQRAWEETISSSLSLPVDLKLVVMRRSQFELLAGNVDDPPAVVIVADAQRFEARVLSSAGQAVLEVGHASSESVATKISATRSFNPRRLNAVDVRLLVDGTPFLPRPGDPPLTSFGLDWLPEVVVIGHELRAEALERGILSTTVNRRVRAIRVRRCSEISLILDDETLKTSDQLPWYAYEHDELPTLILNDELPLSLATLAETLSGGIARLIDPRLRSLENTMLRLALGSASTQLESPSDEVLAHVFDCDLQTIRDHRAALRTDLDHILSLLVPLVAYLRGVPLSRQLKMEVEREGVRFDLRKWLRDNLGVQSLTPDEIVVACEKAESPAALRRTLDLDFARFNEVLTALGEEPISNAAELQRVYEAYLSSMRTEIVDRLRRRYTRDFREESDLSTYTKQKELGFLPFNQEWCQSYDTLDTEMVQTYVGQLLDGALGPDAAENLEPLKRVLEANRKIVRSFATEAAPVVRAWCRQHDVAAPAAWLHDEAQAIVRQLEDHGLLDFEVLNMPSIPGFCVRCQCWPGAMPPTIDEAKLQLDKEEIGAEEKRREQERARIELERRSIHFGGGSFDTRDPNFAGNFQEEAEKWLQRDENWYQRSQQRPRMTTFSDPDASPSGGSGGTGTNGGARSHEQKLSDAQRTAMGVASEWLAFQYLSRRHQGHVDENCWVSENRIRFFGGGKGKDSAGYDFLVKTPTCDWMYEVKSSLDNGGEFELTANEMRVASTASKDGRRRYRILYVPFVFSPEKWRILELPNPMGEATRNRFKIVGRGSVRMRFEIG